MDEFEKKAGKKIADDLGKALIFRKETVAVAESVTAGNLQLALSLADKALDFFQGGITAYNIGQKAKHLAIDPIHGDQCNCVSEKIAASMAMGATVLFNCDWGIGITGYASPVPEEGINELFACFAIAQKNKIVIAQTITTTHANPLEVRMFYTKYVLECFLEIVTEKLHKQLDHEHLD